MALVEAPGEAVDDRTVPFSPRTLMSGAYTSLVPLSLCRYPDLFRHLGGSHNAHLWAFLPSDPFLDEDTCDAVIKQWSLSEVPQYFAVINLQGEALGIMSFLSINPGHRGIKIGWVVLGDALKRTRQATETFFLMLKRAFDELGYQRVAWRANSLNTPSLSAAERLGFVFEGTFRKHWIVKGKRRDTAWYSITDDEWPTVKRGFQAWLHEDNFDKDGKQRRSLKDCRAIST
ncbi:hypothetical protein CEP53_005176 [Fusarium sp. AF-6]|nr:hypothetical protein CEP53_005176 [Fusarium sp. AF-6]